jgi:chitin disaccharide deacetylase
MDDADRGVQLIVLSDDFGMCHAVNEGIVEAFTEGILTQSTLMVPCPWFSEAVALARRHRIPVGIHYTLTCDWEHLRWGPLTRAPSLTDGEGAFHRTVAAALAHARPDEIVAEYAAQTDRLIATGLVHTHFECHMNIIPVAACAEMTRRYGRRSRQLEVPGAIRFASVLRLTERDTAEKKPWLLARLAALTPGVHLLVCHCGRPGPELSSLTPRDAGPYRWTEEYRAADLALMTDPEVRAEIDRLGIRLRSFADADLG